jgi:hypothetical protein
MKRLIWVAMIAASAVCGQNNAAPRGANGNAGRDPCDRACLEGFVDRYLDAMVAHDPQRVPIRAGAKFTENGQRLQIPDGLWNSMAAKGSYRLFVTDTDNGEAAFIGTIREEGRTPSETLPGVIALRLKIERGEIAEIETLVVRNERAAQNFEKLGKPDPLFTEAIPPAERASREDLIRTANMYFTGMQQNDGKGVYPFADDCNRIENGMQTTNVPTPPGQTRPDPATATSYSAQWSCKEQFQSGLLHFVTRIRDRRYVAVDRERGLVFSFVFFDHAAGKTRTFQTPSGRTVTAGPSQPWTWEIAEIFKIERGKIRRIEAVLEHSAYGMTSGWSSWEDAMSDRARDIK